MAARRGHGESSIYRDGDRWRGSLEVGRGPDGKRRRKKVRGKTKAEVLAKLRDLQNIVDSGLPAPNDRMTVGEFLDRWLAVNVPGSVGPSTRDSYVDTVRLHLKPSLGRRVLTRVTVGELNALWAEKRTAGYSANSVRIMRTVLRRAFGQAEREGLVARNVAALSTPPRVRAEVGRTLTVEQAKRFLDSVRGHRLEPMFVLMLAYGMRRGEALGLMWRGLDWDARTLSVTHGVRRVQNHDPDNPRKTQIWIGELKTRRARRTLYLTPQLLDLLRLHRERQSAERAALGEAWQDTDLIFCTERGTVLDPDNISHLFSRMCSKAGLGHWHAHELRHSGASLMLANGTPLHVVSEILGHASIVVTKDVYGHLVEGEKRAAATAITEVLFGPPAGPDDEAPPES